MAARYRRTFTFVDTEEQAIAFCNKENKNRYIRQHHKATYILWTSKDGLTYKYIVWYVTK